MTHLCSIGGLRVRSSIELSSLVAADGANSGWVGDLDLRVEIGMPVEHDVVSHEWRHGYRMRIGGKEGRGAARPLLADDGCAKAAIG